MMRPPQRFKLFLKYMAAALCCTCLASCSDDLSSSAAQATKPLAVDTEIDETLGVELTGLARPTVMMARRPLILIRNLSVLTLREIFC